MENPGKSRKSHKSLKPRTAGVSTVEQALGGLAASLEEGSSTPLYRQISSRIEEEIESGRLKPGDRLPAERKLMEVLRVSRSTVRIALGELIGRHYLSASHGRGNFVLEPPTRRELRFLAIERFNSKPWSLFPEHYDLVHTAEESSGAVVHYKHAPTVEKLCAILREPPSGYHGILIFRPDQEWVNALLSMKERSGLPLIVVSRDLSGSSLNFVSPNHFQNGYEAARWLIKAGHRRIGYLSGSLVTDYVRITREGYLKAMEEAGLPPLPQDETYFDSFDTAASVKRVETFIAGRGFTAILAAGSYPSLILGQVGSARDLPASLICEQYILGRIGSDWPAFIYPDKQVIERSLSALSEMARSQHPAPIRELFPPIFHPATAT